MLSTRREALAGVLATLGFPFIGESSPVRSMISVNETKLDQFEEEQYSESSYVQDGLIALFDGEDNYGWGVHETNPSKWLNLIDGRTINLNTGVVFGDTFATTDETFSSKFFGRSMDGNNGYNYPYISSEVCFETEIQDRQFVIIDMYRRSCMGVWDTNIGVGYWKAVPFGKSAIGEIITASAIYPSDTDNIPSSQFVDGQFKNLTNVNFSQPLSSCTIIGGSPYDRAFAGKIHCIRLYDRQLTEEEVVWNSNVDKHRFRTK